MHIYINLKIGGVMNAKKILLMIVFVVLNASIAFYMACKFYSLGAVELLFYATDLVIGGWYATKDILNGQFSLYGVKF